MIFRLCRSVPLLMACAVYTLSARENAPSSPSRPALLQRAAIADDAGRDSVRDSQDDPIAEVRRALFKLTRPTIVLPPETPVIAVLPGPTNLPTAKDSARSAAPPEVKFETPPRSLAATPREAVAPKAVATPSINVPGDNALALRELALQPAGFTPYDCYLGPVRSVISSLPNRGSSIAAACSFMREAHAFRYATRDPYRADPPAVTAARHEGDCKSKALWLYDQLGDPSALYVIGKVARGAKASHAWVYWRYESRWWILDPTNRAAPIAVDSVGRASYVPYYSFGKDGAFRHSATQLLLAQNDVVAHTPAVASHPTKRRKRR